MLGYVNPSSNLSSEEGVGGKEVRAEGTKGWPWHWSGDAPPGKFPGVSHNSFWMPGGGGLVAKSCLTLCNPMDCVAHQAPLPMEFSRQEHWSGLPFYSQGIFLTQGLNTHLPHCRQILYHEATKEALWMLEANWASTLLAFLAVSCSHVWMPLGLLVLGGSFRSPLT